MLQKLKKYFSDQGPLAVVRIVIITWIISKLLCYSLWLDNRFFPLVPVHEILLLLPSYVHSILLWSSFFLMLVFFIFPRKKLALVIVLLEILSCLSDQNRWQPWEYQFIFMLLCYALFASRQHLYTAWQIILVGLYFFSGLSKFNQAFIHDIWNNLILHNWLGIINKHVFIFRLGYTIPMLEMLAAIFLCFTRFRKMGLLILCGMHFFVLLVFGPLGINWNPVIWPWNIAMPFLLLTLFYHHSFLPSRNFFAKPISWLLIPCFCILPWLQLVSKWDHYLSFALYSGGVSQLYICTDNPAALQRMSVYMGVSKNGMIPCNYPVSVFRWGYKELGIIPYPEQRVFISIAKQWKKKFPAAKVKFYIYTSGFAPKVNELLVADD